MNKSFKQEFLEALIQGLVEGGYPEDAAKSLWPLFEKIYDSGYKEARRNIVYSEDVSKMSLSECREYVEKVRNELR